MPRPLRSCSPPGLAGTSADAGNLAPNLNIRSPAVTNAATLSAGRGYGYPSYVPPPVAAPTRPRFTEFTTNDQFDTNGNLNPGGGGGMKPGKKPNLQMMIPLRRLRARRRRRLLAKDHLDWLYAVTVTPSASHVTRRTALRRALKVSFLRQLSERTLELA